MCQNLILLKYSIKDVTWSGENVGSDILEKRIQSTEKWEQVWSCEVIVGAGSGAGRSSHSTHRIIYKGFGYIENGTIYTFQYDNISQPTMKRWIITIIRRNLTDNEAQHNFKTAGYFWMNGAKITAQTIYEANIFAVMLRYLIPQLSIKI